MKVSESTKQFVKSEAKVLLATTFGIFAQRMFMKLIFKK